MVDHHYHHYLSVHHFQMHSLRLLSSPGSICRIAPLLTFVWDRIYFSEPKGHFSFSVSQIDYSSSCQAVRFHLLPSPVILSPMNLYYRFTCLPDYQYQRYLQTHCHLSPQLIQMNWVWALSQAQLASFELHIPEKLSHSPHFLSYYVDWPAPSSEWSTDLQLLPLTFLALYIRDSQTFSPC